MYCTGKGTGALSLLESNMQDRGCVILGNKNKVYLTSYEDSLSEKVSSQDHEYMLSLLIFKQLCIIRSQVVYAKPYFRVFLSVI